MQLQTNKIFKNKYRHIHMANFQNLQVDKQVTDEYVQVTDSEYA